MLLELKQYCKLCHRLGEYVRKRTFNLEEDLPTFRELARRYHISHQLVEQIVGDVEVLNYNVGIGGQGGYSIFKHKGDYTVEWMD